MFNSANANVKETTINVISIGHGYHNRLEVIIPVGEEENPIIFRHCDNDREKLIKLGKKIAGFLPEEDEELTADDTDWYVKMIYSMVEGEDEIRRYRKAIGKF